MLREDVAAARKAWLAENQNASSESDFLLPENNDGERLDFHSLRHSCGSWLAMSGANPKLIQAVMRHSTITLTMDTYGHLFPGQETEAADRMALLLGPPSETDSRKKSPRVSKNALQQAQQLGLSSEQDDARACDEEVATMLEKLDDKPLILLGLSDLEHPDATGCESSGRGIRTPDTRIMIPLL